MNKIKIGVLCPSEIAFRRFLPSLLECENFEYIGVAAATADEWDGETADGGVIESELKKAQRFKDNFGGTIFEGYSKMISCSDIDAIYIPLPPALHYKWGKRVLQNGKHLLLEKPFTVSEEKSKELIDLAKEKNLAVHENYMFLYHSQLDYIRKLMPKIGDVRGIRAAFTFPMRSAGDFRYVKELGGGALLDCGGYPIRLVTELLGDKVTVDTARLQYIDGYDVDFYGSATLSNDKITAQIIFGMDNSYKCELEIQGAKGCIYTDRIFTAPDGYEPEITLTLGNEKKIIKLQSDNSFKKSIERFFASILNREKRNEMFLNILTQAKAVDYIKE